MARGISPSLLKSLAILKRQSLDALSPKTITANDSYLVIGRSHDHFQTWARSFGLSTIGFRYVSDLQQARGCADYHLVVLPGHSLNVDQVECLVQNACNIYHANLYYPVTETGKIVRWMEYENGKE